MLTTYYTSIILGGGGARQSRDALEVELVGPSPIGPIVQHGGASAQR
jgi:hypothetical protein